MAPILTNSRRVHRRRRVLLTMGFFGIDQISFADDGSIIFRDPLVLEVERCGSVPRTAILRCAPDRPIPTPVPPSPRCQPPTPQAVLTRGAVGTAHMTSLLRAPAAPRG